MRRDAFVVGSKDGDEHHLQGNEAYVAGYIDTDFLMGCLLPPPEQRDIGCSNDLGQRANHFAVKRGLDHPTLSFPEFSFTHHKAVAEE